MLTPLVHLLLLTSSFIRGGSTVNAVYKGVRVNVTVDSKLLASQSQVTWLGLTNMNLTSAVNDIAGNLPSELQRVDFSNTGLAEFPIALTNAKMLDIMWVLHGCDRLRPASTDSASQLTRTLCCHRTLAFNDIEHVTAEHSMASVTQLYANKWKELAIRSWGHADMDWDAGVVRSGINVNKLKSFTALYPKLVYLYVQEVRTSTHCMLMAQSVSSASYARDLSYNQLQSVPKILANYSLLTSMYVAASLETASA